MRVEDLDLDGGAPPGTVEIAVAYCGICGSDLAEYAQGPVVIPTDRPHPLTGHRGSVTLGHEFAGVVVDVGDGVTGVAVGDRVSADACWRCNACPACRRGEYNLCPLGGAIGMVSDGAMASRVRVPDYCVVPLPDGVSLRAGALLEPFAVALHALDRGRATPGDRVLITGFGPIGAATAELAKATGLETLVIEPDEQRRARATALGHATVTGETARDRARAIKSRTGGGVPLAVDSSGVVAGIQQGIAALRRGGTVVVAGIPKAPLEIDAARLVLMEHAVVGTLGYHHDLPRVAAMIASGALDAERIVTREAPVADAVGCFEHLASGATDDLKILLEIGAHA